MAKTKGKSKKELLTEQIAAAVGAGREAAVETVDFADPDRPKTCLEVDFPIIPINQIAAIETNAGKPIYQMSKWWARRRSSVFRSMLLAAAMKAPEDESKAAKAVWEAYYSNHQKRGTLRHLNVVDPFMGGGTTIVEGVRLGMQMYGMDLNPVAWFVVKNELAQVDIEEVKRLLADIEAEVKPQIMPYYACDGPSGEKGKWLRIADGADQDLPASFDIFSVPWQERKHYRYEGPEIIYTFWAKHGPCQREGCGHRTPIMTTPVIAVKTLTVDAWADWECRGCGTSFDVERHGARMAPDAPLFVAPDEKLFVVMDGGGRFACPHCDKRYEDTKAAVDGNSISLGKSKNKKVNLTLLIHPQWLGGCPKHDEEGREYGGSMTDSVEATVRWNNARAAKLRLLEVRGALPEQVTCPDTNITFFTDRRGGTIAKKSTFTCAADGSPNDVLEAIRASGKGGPTAAYVIQGYSRNRALAGTAYSGRFFSTSCDARPYNTAIVDWERLKDAELSPYWPRSEILVGHEIGPHDVFGHQFTHWWKMFNPRQLLVNSLFLKVICESKCSDAAKDFVLGLFQNFLRNENMFCFWHLSHDHFVPHLSNSNFRPMNTMVEVGPFSPVGYGPWHSSAQSGEESLLWKTGPWEIFPAQQAQETPWDDVAKGVKVLTGDAVSVARSLSCGSATDLSNFATSEVDLVITDPPFGDLLQYSEMADFFYVWLRLALKSRYPEQFSAEYTPKALEAVSNKARQPEDPDGFYQRILTDCWRESHRVLKPGGILAFTFHHSEDEPWVGVLESLFDAGFYLEATYPIRSDETKGEGEFGSKQIEYDIIHVCRKRITEPQAISWARLRRLIVDDVRRIKTLLSQHQKEGLPAADLQVIKRGKALEYFSRHYGKVFIEQGREFTIREALVGINQLLDDDNGSSGGPEAPPLNAEPYTRQFFRLFYETSQVPRDQMQKFLRGTGIAPSDFEERGWCVEKHKVFTLTPPIDLARAWKGAPRKGMARDFDQTMFLVGGCVEGSNIRVMDTLDSPNFAPHPATAELVDWLTRHGASQEIKFAAQRARTIYRDWLGKNKTKAQEQLQLFDLET
jgi:putative DNA methylase